MNKSETQNRLINESNEFVTWAEKEFGPESTNRNDQGEFVNAEAKMAWAGWRAKAERVPKRLTLERIERFVLWFSFAYISTQMTYNILYMLGKMK